MAQHAESGQGGHSYDTGNDATGEAQPLVTPESPTLDRGVTDNDATGEAQPRSTVKRRRLAPQQRAAAPLGAATAAAGAAVAVAAAASPRGLERKRQRV